MTWHPGIPEDYRNQVVTGDCRELAKRLPDESVGVVLTSPPYNVGLNYRGYDDDLEHDEFIEFNRQWLAIAFQKLQEEGRLYACISDRMLWWFRDLATDAGFTFAQKLVWCKPNFVSMAKNITQDWNFMTEDILLFRKGKRTPMLSSELTTTHNWFLETVPQRNHKSGRIHPAQWPVSLCLRILSRTPGDPVLDMFAGSGSAMVAAKMLGRSYIGFELVEEVSSAARKRIANTQTPLFTLEPEPVQGELFPSPAPASAAGAGVERAEHVER